jgi:hypothetical protein
MIMGAQSPEPPIRYISAATQSTQIGRLAPSQVSDGRAAPLDRSSLDFRRSPLSRRLALASPRTVG